MNFKKIVFCLAVLGLLAPIPSPAMDSSADKTFLESVLSGNWKPSNNHHREILIRFSVDNDGKIKHVSGIESLPTDNKKDIVRALDALSSKIDAFTQYLNSTFEVLFYMSYPFGQEQYGYPGARLWRYGKSEFLRNARVEFDKCEWKQALINFNNHLETHRPSIEVVAKIFICEYKLESDPHLRQKLAKKSLDYLKKLKPEPGEKTEKIKEEASIESI